jgi:hypothetical protein
LFFFITGGIVHFEYLEQSRKVMLASLREAVLWRRPHLRPDTWILRHDNAPTRDTHSVRELLANNKTITKLNHSPYIRHIWSSATFGYFLNCRPLWRATDFQTSLIFRDMWRPSWTACQKRGSRNVLNSRNIDSLNCTAAQGDSSKLGGCQCGRN